MANLPTSPYWIHRAELVLTTNEKTALEYEQDLKAAYKATIENINTEVNAFYGKYATDNQITLAEAKKILKPTQMKAFQSKSKAYLKEVEKFLAQESAGILDANALAEYKAYLKTMSGKAYVSKMDEIKTNIRHNIEMNAVGNAVGLGNTLQDAYQDGYFQTLFNVQKQAGFGVSFTAPGGEQLKAAVNERWLGQNYSDAIWNDKNHLIKQLDQLLSQEFVMGKGSSSVAKMLSDKMGTSFNNAKRLIRTEINHISNKGTMQAYRESAVVDQYEYVSTLDNRTSDICIELDGTKFPLKEAAPGINMPPMHPYCRSTTIPYFPEDEIGAAVTDRVARNAEGKTYPVGKDVTFKEWTENYAEAAYAKKVAKNPKKYVATAPVEPFTLEGMSYMQFQEFLKTPVADLPLDKYAPNDLVNAVVDWTKKGFGLNTSEAYANYNVMKFAAKVGVSGDVMDFIKDPYLLDMKLNNVTKFQAQNRMIVGEPVEDLKKYIKDNKISDETIFSNFKKSLSAYSHAATPEQAAKKIDYLYKINNPNSKWTFFDKASKGTASLEAKELYQEWKSIYDIKGLPAASISKFINGKYPDLDSAKQANKEQFAKVKANKATGSKTKTKAVQPIDLKGNPFEIEIHKEYTQAELNDLSIKANWYKTGRDADKHYRPWTAHYWSQYTKAEILAAYEYTSGSGGFNRPLVGYKGSWARYNFDENVSLNYEGDEKHIINLYKMIDKSPIPELTKVRRGGTAGEVISKQSGMFKGFIPKDILDRDNDRTSMEYVLQNKDKIEGKVLQIQNFLSTGVSNESGFSASDVEYRVVLPAGTKATYAEPYSHYGGNMYGKQGGKNWDGNPDNTGGSVGSEAEIIVQAGTSYIVNKIEPGQGRFALFVELIAIPESQSKPPKKLEGLV